VGSRRLGYSLQRRIEALDPACEDQEIARLTFEVLFGDPISVHAALLTGFSRQVADPGIAEVIYRGGEGKVLRGVARRNDDTLALFGAFFKWGYSSPGGRAAIARMEQIHSRFPITDEQKRYTLATLIFEPERIAAHLRVDLFSAAQRQASWRFWCGVARQMPLGDLPASPEQLWGWMRNYERRNWRYSDAGRRVVDCFFEDWATRWFPRSAKPIARQLLLALMDADLRTALRLEAPSRPLDLLVRTSARAYSPLIRIRPYRTDRSWLDHFGAATRLSPTPSR
jgi:hypothetical protein